MALRTDFTTDNTISTVGNYRIFSYTMPFQGAVLLGVDDSVTGVQTGARLRRDLRWSRDSKSWSLWQEFTDSDLSAFEAPSAEDTFYLDLRYSVVPDTDVSPDLEDGTELSPTVVIEWIDILATQSPDTFAEAGPPETRCSAEGGLNPIQFKKGYTFDPYAVNRGVMMYEQMSSFVNQAFGHEVQYFRVIPQLRSKEVVFKEWTLLEAEPHKCVKILVPNNEFPDSRPKYDPFGPAFEVPFEVHIDRSYWASIFGKSTMPQEKDFLYFPLLNRMYEVQSTYAFKDFMQVPMYYKVLLAKYEDRASVLKSVAIADLIDSATLTTEELFGEEMTSQTKRVMKPEQYTLITHDQDPTRAVVNRLLSVVRYDLYNYWTLVADHYYDMSSLYASEGAVIAVTYRQGGSLSLTSSRAFVCWFCPQTGTGQRRSLITCVDDYGNGWKVDLLFSEQAGGAQVEVTMGAAVYSFQLTGTTILRDSWYGLVVNVSNEFSQVGVSLYEMQANDATLKKMYSSTQAVTPYACTPDADLRLVASQVFLTNLRLFDRMVEDEQQAIVLSQQVVGDSEKALMIDNARPLLRLARIGDPK